VSVFRGYGLADDLAKSDFLEANALKTLGRQSEALARFEKVHARVNTSENPLLAGLALISIGELQAQAGDPTGAFETLARAMPHIRAADAPMGLGQVHGITAEILKNEGDLANAAREYGKAASIYEAAGMSGSEAYSRLLRADVLLTSGRDEEAIAELVRALPVMEREGRDVEEFAAVALLSEALRRSNVDSKTITNLRTWLIGTQGRR